MCMATRLRRYFVVGLALCALSATARADWFEYNAGRGPAIYYSSGYNGYYPAPPPAPAPYPQYGYNGNAAYLLQQAATMLGNRGYNPNPVYYGNGYYNGPVYYGNGYRGFQGYYAPPGFRHHHHHGHHHHHD